MERKNLIDVKHMDEKVVKLLFALLRSAINNVPLDEKAKALYSDGLLQPLFTIAKKHDITHLAALGIKNNDLGGKYIKIIEKEIFRAQYRYTKLKHETDQLYEILEQEKFRFIPLKGSIIRNYYPEAWMRSSCDVDLLVEEKNVDEIAQMLVEKMHYRYEKKNYHDISLKSPYNIQLELHFNIKENMETMDEVLSECWSHAIKQTCYKYQFNNEFFMFHQIAHAAYHFLHGGCGIRSLMDLWILNQKFQYDYRELEIFLKRAGLFEFAGEMENLSRVWFENGEYTETAYQMENYIFRGGVYGSRNNLANVKTANGIGKIHAFTELMFLKQDDLEKIYPIIKKYPILYPFLQVKRWFKIFDKDKRKKIEDLTRIQNSVLQEDVDQVRKMLEKLNLSDK